MRIVALSDTHLQYDFNEIPEGDLLIHAGDAMNRGDFDDLMQFVGDLKKCAHRFERIIYVPGNHDRLLQNDPIGAKNIFNTDVGNVTVLIDSGLPFKGLNFWGSPYTPTFGKWAFMKDRGKDMKEHWKKIPADTDVLITHGPPAGILDKVRGIDEYLGCQGLLEAVRAVRPRVHVFGHIHDSYGQSHVWLCNELKFRFYNVSICNEQYRPINKPKIFEI